MISSRRDVHMKGYGMGKEELVPCGKENQGRGPCVDKLVLNSLWGTPGNVEGSDPAEDPAWAKALPFCAKAQWFSKYWSIHTMEYRSEIKRTALFIHATTRINLKGIMPSEKASFKTLLYHFLYMTFFFVCVCWVFAAARGLSLIAASRGYSSLQWVGFSLRWLLLLQNTGSRRVGFSSCSARAQQLQYTGPKACGLQ